MFDIARKWVIFKDEADIYGIIYVWFAQVITGLKCSGYACTICHIVVTLDNSCSSSCPDNDATCVWHENIIGLEVSPKCQSIKYVNSGKIPFYCDNVLFRLNGKAVDLHHTVGPHNVNTNYELCMSY